MSRAGHRSNYLLLTFPSECLLVMQTLWSVLLLHLLIVLCGFFFSSPFSFLCVCSVCLVFGEIAYDEFLFVFWVFCLLFVFLRWWVWLTGHLPV